MPDVLRHTRWRVNQESHPKKGGFFVFGRYKYLVWRLNIYILINITQQELIFESSWV